MGSQRLEEGAVNGWLTGAQFLRQVEQVLFPVKAPSKVFRGKSIHYLQKAFLAGKLLFPGKAGSLGTQKGFSNLIKQLWSKEWVVYSKRPFAGPEQVLDYLGRYTHRVAIANHHHTIYPWIAPQGIFFEAIASNSLCSG